VCVYGIWNRVTLVLTVSCPWRPRSV